ncbi:MAG: ankyrin repeat domain-containing protein [Pseudomonadota bacterium]
MTIKFLLLLILIFSGFNVLAQQNEAETVIIDNNVTDFNEIINDSNKEVIKQLIKRQEEKDGDVVIATNESNSQINNADDLPPLLDGLPPLPPLIQNTDNNIDNLVVPLPQIADEKNQQLVELPNRPISNQEFGNDSSNELIILPSTEEMLGLVRDNERNSEPNQPIIPGNQDITNALDDEINNRLPQIPALPSLVIEDGNSNSSNDNQDRLDSLPPLAIPSAPSIPVIPNLPNIEPRQEDLSTPKIITENQAIPSPPIVSSAPNIVPPTGSPALIPPNINNNLVNNNDVEKNIPEVNNNITPNIVRQVPNIADNKANIQNENNDNAIMGALFNWGGESSNAEDEIVDPTSTDFINNIVPNSDVDGLIKSTNRAIAQQNNQDTEIAEVTIIDDNKLSDAEDNKKKTDDGADDNGKLPNYVQRNPKPNVTYDPFAKRKYHNYKTYIVPDALIPAKNDADNSHIGQPVTKEILINNYFKANIDGNLHALRALKQSDYINNFNITNKQGKQGANIVTQYSHLDNLRYMIVNGLDVNKADQQAIAPIHIAAAVGRTDIVDSLLAANADRMAEDKYGNTPFDYALAFGNIDLLATFANHSNFNLNRHLADGSTPLINAMKENNLEKFKLLLHYGADIEFADDNNYTPLMLAAYNGISDFVQALIALGADLNKKDAFGRNAADLAAISGYRNLFTNIMSAYFHGLLNKQDYLIDESAPWRPRVPVAPTISTFMKLCIS